MIKLALLLCQVGWVLGVPLLVSPAYKRNLLVSTAKELEPTEPQLQSIESSNVFTPAESSALRELLRNGDPQAWQVYGDEVDDYLTELMANGIIQSIEEGLVRLLYPELSNADVNRLVQQTEGMLAALEDATEDYGDIFIPDADKIHKYEMFTPEVQSDLSLEDSIIQKALLRAQDSKKLNGQVYKKEERKDSDFKPISDAEMLNFLSNSQSPIENTKRSAANVVTSTSVPKSVELKRGQPEVPFFPGGNFKPKK